MKKLVRIGLIMLCLVMTIFTFVGCVNKFDENKTIVAVSREQGSGTRDAFMELVFGKEFGNIALPATSVVQTSTLAVLTKVENDPQAIAYDSFGYITDKVNMLKVNGVECTAENIRSGDYKIMRPFLVVYKESRMTPLNLKFKEFLTSSDVQPIIAADGLIGDNTRTTAYVPEEGLTGSIKISGGTAVQLLVVKIAEEFEKIQPGVTIEVGGGGSGTGRNDVRDDNVDFGMVGTAVTAAHITDMESKGGTVDSTKICDDGIAVIVNKSNTFDNITIDQLKNIYNNDAETKYDSWASLKA